VKSSFRATPAKAGGDPESRNFNQFSIPALGLIPAATAFAGVAEIHPNPPLQRGAGGISGRSFQRAKQIPFQLLFTAKAVTDMLQIRKKVEPWKG